MIESTNEIINDVWRGRFSVKTPLPDDTSNFKIFVEEEWYSVGSPGCLGLFTGRQKSRKTFALSCVVASAITGEEVGPFKYENNGGLILWFDTEQPKGRFLITQHRIHKLAGVASDCEHYLAFSLRKYNVEDRLFIIGWYIDYLTTKGQKIDLIVIDGVVDLCENMMESSMSQKTAQSLMTWADTTGASIFTVLHLNKNGGEVRGHLGTELGNKADFTLAVQKKHDEDIHSTISCKDSRYYPFKSFELYQDKDGMLNMERGTWQPKKDIIFPMGNATVSFPASGMNTTVYNTEYEGLGEFM